MAGKVLVKESCQGKLFAMSSTLIIYLGLNVFVFASVIGTQLLAGRSLLLRSQSRYLDEMDAHLCMYFHFHIY